MENNNNENQEYHQIDQTGEYEDGLLDDLLGDYGDEDETSNTVAAKPPNNDIH